MGITGKDLIDLASVVDVMPPHGAIMAGDGRRDTPWRKTQAVS